MSEISLQELFRRSLESASKSVNLPTIAEETQDLLQHTLLDLREVHSRIRDLSLFSPNESLDDIPTKDMVCLTLPYVFAEVENRTRTTERHDRMGVLTKVISHLEAFVHQLEHYDIIPEDEKKLYSHKSSMLADPAKRRDVKVSQYKKVKEIKDRLQVLQKQRNQTQTPDSQTDFDLIASLLPSSTTSAAQSSEDSELDLDSTTDDLLRTTTILLLRIFYAQTHTQLESMEQELDLLRRAPPSPSGAPPPLGERDGRTKIGDKGKSKEEQEEMWRLDLGVSGSGGPDGKGPLVDHRGRPLRPFTILPSNAAERARLQTQVFGPGYNLPTMSVDEYLEIERERGNIITGGGPASLEKPTSSEQLQIDSEMDGTVAGEEKEEEKRQKDEKWAQYKDTHARGAGNTMNRG
ncbi:hypothetical protein P691DRAFT_673853 [Macrolepiota fuliginosa MF-IS2]|uniref:TAP42-like protein n=1 Tax=Macrolepiota fuliginosa MF-IS2 TaxID=1400762 RepID=A0A9P5X879_9AGAR|nr:hypothetical protein P691DRAFT_673853 [Macrolepiota fuliginosa MF-IS2]